MSKYLASIEERANKPSCNVISHSKLITCEDSFPDAYPILCGKQSLKF